MEIQNEIDLKGKEISFAKQIWGKFPFKAFIWNAQKGDFTGISIFFFEYQLIRLNIFRTVIVEST